MIAALVLAAGESKRMGGAKLLLPFRGQPVISSVVAALRDVPLGGIFVVLGGHGREVREALQGAGLEFVFNPDYKKGMLSSVQAGIQALPPETEAALVCLGDQPGLNPSVVSALLSARARSGKGLVLPVHGGRRGHPLLLDLKHRTEVMTLEGGVGLRELLRRHPADVEEVAVEDASVLQDMDTPAAYRRLEESKDKR